MSSSFYPQSPQLTKTVELMNGWGARGIPFIFIIDFELQKPLVLPLAEAQSQGIFYALGDCTNFQISNDEGSISPKPLGVVAPDFSWYRQAFKKVQAELYRGNSYLLNLTGISKIESSLSLRQMFRVANAANRLLFKNEFVVFSPETFVSISNGVIATHPMKGTRVWQGTATEEELFNDAKESAEHATVVDLLRSDLSVMAYEVRVKRFKYFQKVRTSSADLLQMSSEIEGRLPDDYHGRLGSILMSLLPAGSVSGAPKRETLKIIRDVEIGPRGYYTGVFGVFDGQSLESAVMIRFIEKTPEGLFFRSGGGITTSSELASEYQELVDKVYLPFDSEVAAQELDSMPLKNINIDPYGAAL